MVITGALTAALIALIFFGGSRWFGRSGTQGLIDRFESYPRFHALLNRWHGEIRASFHYIEFGGLSLLSHLLLRHWWPEGVWSWQAALITIPLCTVIAFLDEKRQELTPGRQFRLMDFHCSVRGLLLMQMIIGSVAFVRWLIEVNGV